MEKGHLRCDANVSIRPKGSTELFTKTEIKNVNSIDNVKNAIEHEVDRQIREVESGNRVQAWTLDWDEAKNELRKMRSKETEADYRYFKEPDLLPIVLDDAWRSAILAQLPELPLARRERFISQYHLPEYDADILTSERSLSDYYEAAVKAYGGDPKRVSNWLMNDVLRLLNERSLTAAELKLTPAYLADILTLMDSNTVNTPTGKTLIEQVQNSGDAPSTIVEHESLAQVSDADALRQVCAAVLAANPEPVANYRKGKETLMGWFVGQVMRATRGKADPQLAKELLEVLLKEAP
jgi:aspartyl-tRNA(Asn)/glutamyl-tRNA(Gln) amidotransferase subunit B